MIGRHRVAAALALILPLAAWAAGGAAAPAAMQTVVTSESLTFDYQNFVASFLDNVRVADPEFTLRADAMNVTFKNSNDVERVALSGNVKLDKDDIEARCGYALYTKGNGQVLMEQSPVVVRDGNRIVGDKMSVWIHEERVLVERHVAVEAKPAKRASGRELAGAMKVTADRLEFDYREFRASFEGNVVVTEPGFTLKADRILVFLENTNDVKRLDAAGHVRFKKDEVTVACGKASYTRDNGLMILQDDPVVSHGQGRIEARKMSIWIDQKRFVVEENVKLSSGAVAGSRDGGATTTVTAQKLEFDYDKFIALFDGGAIASNPEMTLEADRMRIFLAGTNRLSRVDAVGRVHLRSGDGPAQAAKHGGQARSFDLVADNMLAHFMEDNALDRVEAAGGVNLKSGDVVGQCGNAVYTAKDGRVRMQENPVVTKGENKIGAKTMSYLIQEERVLIEEEVAGEVLPSSVEKGVVP